MINKYIIILQCSINITPPHKSHLLANEDSGDALKVAAGFMNKFNKLLMLLFLLLGLFLQIYNFGASLAAALTTRS